MWLKSINLSWNNMELLVQYKVWYLKFVSFPDHYLKLKHSSQCHISSAHLSAAHILKPHEYLVSFLGAAHDPNLTKALSPPTSLTPDEPTHIWKKIGTYQRVSELCFSPQTLCCSWAAHLKTEKSHVEANSKVSLESQASTRVIRTDIQTIREQFLTVLITTG